MTTVNEAAGRIYEAFLAGWTATAASAVTFDNEKFKPPPDGDWARVTVRLLNRQQESLGPLNGRKFQDTGVVFVQCFTPLNVGRSRADTLAANARSIFEGKTLLPEGIRFTSATVREIGAGEEWYQINVQADFTFTETK